MKLLHQDSRRPRISQAREVLDRSNEKKFSARALLTPGEWAEARQTILERIVKNFSYVQDRYFLAFAEGRMEDIEKDAEELFKVGKGWIEELTEKPEEAVRKNSQQLLHCMGMLARIVPNKRDQIPHRLLLKSFFHEAPGFVFHIDRMHKPAIGTRIMLRSAIEYINLFPEDREWAYEQLKRNIDAKKIQRLLDELALAGDWSEYSKLGANARILFPDQVTPGHIPEVAAWFTTNKYNHRGMGYTQLPDLCDIRILAAQEASLNSEGQIQLTEQTALSTQKPIPDRLIA